MAFNPFRIQKSPYKVLRHVGAMVINPPVVQFSPPRSGSTLVYNVLRICFPDKKVQKRHVLPWFARYGCKHFPIVASVRNPLDSISSSLLRFNKEPTKEALQQEMDRFEKYGLVDIVKMSSRKNTLVLKYEEFAFDYYRLFTELENFLGKEISYHHKEKIGKEYSIGAVEEKSTQLGTFDNYDQLDLIHGQHISHFRGAIGYHKYILSQEEIKSIYHRFRDVFDDFGYDNPLAPPACSP